MLWTRAGVPLSRTIPVTGRRRFASRRWLSSSAALEEEAFDDAYADSFIERTTNGYKWQTLYDEAHEMMMGKIKDCLFIPLFPCDFYSSRHSPITASFVSYPLTFLLRAARAGRLKRSDHVLEKLKAGTDGNMMTCLYPHDFLPLIQDNFDYIEANYPFGGKFGWFSVIKLYQRMEHLAEDGESGMGLMEFDDKQEESRLVYGIAVNKRQKRITVIFRGTYADKTRDWARNLQFGQVEVPLPEAALLHNSASEATTTKLLMHRGIYEYLLHNSERGLDYPKERYEEILGHILKCLDIYPGYRLFVTGHSLGGALALLLAFFTASDERIPKPVTCVSLGSLMVGDATFQKAFERFEALGWIRHLRITNEFDPIPCLPPFDWMYKPVGMHLELLAKEGHVLEHHSYSTRSRLNSFSGLYRSYQASGAWEGGIQKWIESHLIPEYLRRLEREKGKLLNMSLNHCYRDPQFVGDHFRTRL